MQFSEGLGSFHAQAVEVQIFRVLSAFEQALGFDAGFGTDGDERESDDVHLAGCFGSKEIGNRQPPAFALARKSEAQNLGSAGTLAAVAEPVLSEVEGSRLRNGRLVDDHIVAI